MLTLIDIRAENITNASAVNCIVLQSATRCDCVNTLSNTFVTCTGTGNISVDDSATLLDIGQSNIDFISAFVDPLSNNYSIDASFAQTYLVSAGFEGSNIVQWAWEVEAPADITISAISSFGANVTLSTLGGITLVAPITATHSVLLSNPEVFNLFSLQQFLAPLSVSDPEHMVLQSSWVEHISIGLSEPEQISLAAIDSFQAGLVAQGSEPISLVTATAVTATISFNDNESLALLAPWKHVVSIQLEKPVRVELSATSDAQVTLGLSNPQTFGLDAAFVSSVLLAVDSDDIQLKTMSDFQTSVALSAPQEINLGTDWIPTSLITLNELEQITLTTNTQFQSQLSFNTPAEFKLAPAVNFVVALEFDSQAITLGTMIALVGRTSEIYLEGSIGG